MKGELIISILISLIMVGVILYVGYLVMQDMVYMSNEFCINKTDGNYSYKRGTVECINGSGNIPATMVTT